MLQFLNMDRLSSDSNNCLLKDTQFIKQLFFKKKYCFSACPFFNIKLLGNFSRYPLYKESSYFGTLLWLSFIWTSCPSYIFVDILAIFEKILEPELPEWKYARPFLALFARNVWLILWVRGKCALLVTLWAFQIKVYIATCSNVDQNRAVIARHLLKIPYSFIKKHKNIPMAILNNLFS